MLNIHLTFGGTLNGVKVYTALLSQELSANPVALILENNLGTVTWHRDGAVRYTASFIDFTIDQTLLTLIE